MNLLSILSCCLLLFFAVQGDLPELYAWEVGFSVSSDEVRVTVDPTWIVWTDLRLTNDALGETFGNVSLIKKSLRGTTIGDCVQIYELNHIRQYYALGWWSYPLSLFIPIESHRIAEMWLPPSSWIDQWHFASITINQYTGADSV